ncbi:hypothetical protein ACQKMI_24320 [Lysinibacillus sp. NPDC097214]|uniref:hypothetical protein n=1 Tax=Lysinibacillus sp. NPDC097214 TaxID=3390584 RepID=UPI003D02023A
MKSQDLEWKHKEYLEELMNLCFDLIYFDLREYERFSYFIPEQPKRLVPSPSIYMWGELIDDGLEITGTVWQPLLIAHFILHCYMEVQHGDN